MSVYVCVESESVCSKLKRRSVESESVSVESVCGKKCVERKSL